MKRRRRDIILTIITALLTFACGYATAGGKTPDRTSTPRKERNAARKDSIEDLRAMAKTLIESVGQLSNTATNLSQAALKLLEADLNEKNTTGSSDGTGTAIRPYIPEAPETPQKAETPVRPNIPDNSIVPYIPEENKPDTVIGTSEEPGHNYGSDSGPDSGELTEAEITEAGSGRKPGKIFPFITLPEDTEPNNESAGSYIWVPKDREAEVTALLEGKPGRFLPKTGTASLTEPRDEKVLFRGDTIPMVLRDRFKFGRYDRGLFNYLFIPKGTWHFSLTASYGEISTADMEMLDVIGDMTIGGRMFSIQPSIHYFIRNNMSLGMRVSYSNAKGYIDSTDVNFDEDINFSLEDIEYKSETYTAGIALTQYVGLTRKGRFGVSNEVELNFSSGNGDFQRPIGGELRKTHTTTMKAGLNFSPGICVFIMKNVSFNLSFGVLGFKLVHEKQWENGVKTGDRTSSGIDFRFNIFNIKFGIGVHI